MEKEKEKISENVITANPNVITNESNLGRILNINVGILGHVDSGKTSLAKALSTHSSTAAFDKSPQSQEKGITLDLGFSALIVKIPSHLSALPYDVLQYTFVDCPGHASLIRTIIGGAQIIDMMLLVIDVTKGFQTQTAEGLVVGEITTNKMVVVLNKVDQFPEETRQTQIDKMKLSVQKKNYKLQNLLLHLLYQLQQNLVLKLVHLHQ